MRQIDAGRPVVLFHKRLIVPGGAERLLLKEYKYFRRMGRKVTIVTFRVDRATLFGEPVADDDLVVLGERYPMALLALARFMRRNPDALFLCASGMTDIYIASLLSGVGYSLHMHRPSYMSFAVDEKYSVLQRRNFGQRVGQSSEAARLLAIRRHMSLRQHLAVNLKTPAWIGAIRRAHHVFVLSEFARREQAEVYGVDAQIIRGALEEEVLGEAPAPALPPDPDGTPKILCIARHDRNKRIDVLIRAMARFLALHPRARLYIGGQGPETQSLVALAETLGVADRVRFLGFIAEDQLMGRYAAADLFVSLEFADYWITGFEALAMGTRVLGSTDAEYEPALMDSGYVHLVAPEPDEVARAMHDALERPVRIDRAELRRILEGYTWENMCHRIIATLDS